MSLRKIDTYCPDCKKPYPVEVEVTDPPPREIVRLMPQDDSAALIKLSTDLAESQQTVEALRAEVQRWQSGENHLAAHDMLAMLETCPNCRPTLEAFVDSRRRQAIARLSPDEVKAIARVQKWWPPPPIELPVRVVRGNR